VPPLTWRVVDFEPGVSFSWQASARGVKTLASHRITQSGDGRCIVTLSIKQTGPLAWLASAAMGKQTRRYVEMEADGLKKYCEKPT
jgi:hypothetical protein